MATLLAGIGEILHTTTRTELTYRAEGTSLNGGVPRTDTLRFAAARDYLLRLYINTPPVAMTETDLNTRRQRGEMLTAREQRGEMLPARH